MFDYSDLLGKIKTVCKTQKAFGAAMGMKLPAVNQRLNNKIDWSPAEIMKACDVLDIDKNEIPRYFFKPKV